ncbi:hypothetical protein AJ80_07872 [Polytolypa hystricis UAMH7299]|uniref:Bromodomain associated domain-containing protein n=1 Tax=Polytolypa hystricis (strain UAMH7299) TaxID=1447883 RepID=A0A2B7XI75_POLH7|nr:hypothetical protein AJ80_07872 [Polytolypa hystricis UAMH7299]
MSAHGLYHTLLRPPVLQILRAAGFHSSRPAVIDTLTDLAARYLVLLAESTVAHATNNHEHDPTPDLHDVLMALQDAGALRPQMTATEEIWRGEEDMRGLEAFAAWFSGPANKEIRRVAGFIAGEGEVMDEDSLEKEDYLNSLKKKHSKTGEESRYQGTVLGKSAEQHQIIIEGGPESIKDWGMQIRSRETSAETVSSAMSSVPSDLSEPADMEI